MKAINELYQICDIEGNEKKVGWRRRREALEEWINKYLVTAETQQSVLNPKVFESEFMDFIKESLTKKLSEDLTTATQYDINNKRISAKMVAIKCLKN